MVNGMALAGALVKTESLGRPPTRSSVKSRTDPTSSMSWNARLSARGGFLNFRYRM